MSTTHLASMTRCERLRVERRARLARMPWIVLTVIVACAWFILLRPSALGGPASYVIVSGTSMQPTLETGDLVVAFRQDSYAVGDIVVYRVPAAEPGSGADIVHRIVGGRDRSGRYLMRGDNKDGVDYWRPTDDEILGKLQLHVPRAGHVLMFLKTTLGMALVAASAAFLLALALFARPDDEEPEVPIPTLR